MIKETDIIEPERLQELNLQRNDDGNTFTLKIKSKIPKTGTNTKFLIAKKLRLDNTTSIKINRKAEENYISNTDDICQVIKANFFSNIKGKLCSYKSDNNDNIYAEIKSLSKDGIIINKLNQGINSIWEIKKGTKIIDAIKELLNHCFSNDDYVIKTHLYNDNINMIKYAQKYIIDTMEWNNSVKIKTILCSLLSISGGYVGKIQDGKLIIYYKDANELLEIK